MNPTTTTPISDARLAANRENAQKSHGATTPEGKAVCRLNALKTALTGVTVLLPDDDVALYATHIKQFEMQFQPVGPLETSLCQSIADQIWRLNRIPALEMAITSTGRVTALQDFPHLAEPGANASLELFVRRAHEKELHNLHLQENRIARRRDREIASIERYQAARKELEAENLAIAAKATLLAEHKQETLTRTPGVGFVFSKMRFDTYMSRLTAAQKGKFLAEAIVEAAPPLETMEAAA